MAAFDPVQDVLTVTTAGQSYTPPNPMGSICIINSGAVDVFVAFNTTTPPTASDGAGRTRIAAGAGFAALFNMRSFAAKTASSSAVLQIVCTQAIAGSVLTP